MADKPSADQFVDGGSGGEAALADAVLEASRRRESRVPWIVVGMAVGIALAGLVVVLAWRPVAARWAEGMVRESTFAHLLTPAAQDGLDAELSRLRRAWLGGRISTSAYARGVQVVLNAPILAVNVGEQIGLTLASGLEADADRARGEVVSARLALALERGALTVEGLRGALGPALADAGVPGARSVYFFGQETWLVGEVDRDDAVGLLARLEGLADACGVEPDVSASRLEATVAAAVEDALRRELWSWAEQ